MGPRSRDRGNTQFVTTHGMRYTGFNGAAITRSRKLATAQPVTQARTLASMGPRSRDRGNGERLVNLAPPLSRFNGAAITRSRKYTKSFPMSYFSGASMGPRSRDRGNPAIRCITRFLMDRLQWGRDHAIAEISRIPASRSVSRELQWGRDHAIAEIRG